MTVKNIKSSDDAEIHDILFDADSRQEEIQTISNVRHHITNVFKDAPNWLVYKKGKEPNEPQLPKEEPLSETEIEKPTE